MTRTARRVGALLAALVALVTVSSRALGQNAEQFYFSDDAALTAGAVVAYPDDPGGLWYDPAALGGIHRARVSLSGSVIGVRLRTVPGALTTRAGSPPRSLDLSAANLISTPHAFTLLFGPSDTTTLGFGVYVTTRDVVSASSHALAEALTDPQGGLSTMRADLLANLTKVSFGPAIGLTLTPELRLGFALFGSLAESTTSTDVLAGVTAPDRPPSLAARVLRLSTSAWELGPTAGLQWDVTGAVHLGLLIRAPELVLSGSGVLEISTIDAAGAETIADERDAAPGLSEPTRVVLGAALDLTDRVRLGLEVALATGIDDDALFLHSSAVVNGRLGLRWSPSDAVVLGCGVFTDLASATSLAAPLGASRVDYVGGTLGGTWRTPVAVLGSAAPDALVLSTTIALRYSVGFGEARVTSTDGLTLRDRATSVTFHDFMPYTGSTVLF